MRTIVCQSYRTAAVPLWISRCLASVEKWAKLKGFDYELVDDRIFDYVPADLFNKMKQHKGAASNLARLQLIKNHLINQYDRAIWIDADVIVFDPEGFTIEITESYAFCREIWLRNEIIWDEKVNNAVTVFTCNTTFLDFYIEACHTVITKKSDKFERWDIGTTFLTTLYSIVPFSLVMSAGIFSPPVTNAILQGKEDIIKKYITLHRHPIGCANLCASFEKCPCDGYILDAAAFNNIIDILLTTKGHVVNRYLE